MMISKTYPFRWKAHESHLTSTFYDLLNQKIFTDVTLVCDDQTEVKAHKMVLSAWSQVFQNIFLANLEAHLVIHLRI